MTDLPEFWHSSYRYYSPDFKAEFDSEHEVRLHHNGNQVIIESLPKGNKSYLVMRLSFNDDLLTGTWEEETDPKGFYKGAIYHGAVQLQVIEDGKKIFGRYVTRNTRNDIVDGSWTLTAKKS